MENLAGENEHLQFNLKIQYVLPRRVTGGRYLSNLSIPLG